MSDINYVPRAKMQKAMDRIRGWQALQALIYQQHYFLYHKGASEALAMALDILEEECGVTPTEENHE